MPTIVYWPEKVKPGESNALLSQVDLYATLAKLVGQKVAPDAAPDSEEHLDAWLGKSDTGRKFLFEESFTFALRMDEWKYIKPFNETPKSWLKNKDVNTGLKSELQLYNLKEDSGELKNVAAQNPDLIDLMNGKLNEITKQN